MTLLSNKSIISNKKKQFCSIPNKQKLEISKTHKPKNLNFTLKSMAMPFFLDFSWVTEFFNIASPSFLHLFVSWKMGCLKDWILGEIEWGQGLQRSPCFIMIAIFLLHFGWFFFFVCLKEFKITFFLYRISCGTWSL